MEDIINEIKGEVRISQNVVTNIAMIAAKEVDGVESVYYDLKEDLAKKLHIKTKSHGVHIDISGREVKVDLVLNMKYNFSIPEVSKNVQDKVKSSIESMTNLDVLEVNVVIAGITPN